MIVRFAAPAPVVLILGAAGPHYLLLKVSVSPPAVFMTPHPLLLPHAVTWRFWERELVSSQITAPLWKSLGVALLALTFAGPAAYSLAHAHLDHSAPGTPRSGGMWSSRLAVVLGRIYAGDLSHPGSQDHAAASLLLSLSGELVQHGCSRNAHDSPGAGPERLLTALPA